MSNLTITTDFGTLTLTTSLGNVQDAMDGRHPTDLGRPDLRTFFRTYTTARSFNLDGTRTMRAILSAVLAYEVEVQVEEAPAAPQVDESKAAEAAALLAVVESKVKAATKVRRSKWESILADAIAQYGEEGATQVTLTQEAMEAMGFSKSARTYCAYWSANPAGRTARAMGWNPSLRKVDGERALVLTKAA